MAVSIREAYGKALAKYGLEDSRVVVLDADVSSSTQSKFFAAACPERFFNVGIAEQNMAAMAAGFASEGFIPFINTFAIFMSSICLLSAETFASYSSLGIKFMGAYGGLSDSFDGPSHQSVADLAIMRALPNVKVYVASDEHQADWLVKNAIEKASEPMYIRLSRAAMPEVYNENTSFADEKGILLREGKDVTIFACGVMVGEAMKAAEILAQKGIEATVVDLFCIKPLDEELVLRCVKSTKAVITAEEHSVIGGLGGAVAETLCRHGAGVPMKMVGLNDLHAECGPYDQLLKKYGLSSERIVESAVELLADVKA